MPQKTPAGILYCHSFSVLHYRIIFDIHPAGGCFLFASTLIILYMSSHKFNKNQQVFLRTGRPSDASTAAKLSPAKHGAPAIATTAHYAFTPNTLT